jgi:hypothetical protein
MLLLCVSVSKPLSMYRYILPVFLCIIVDDTVASICLYEFSHDLKKSQQRL